MPDEQGIETIINSGSQQSEAGASSPPDVSSEESEELISTLNVQGVDTDPEGANKTGAEEDKGKDKDKDESGKDKDESDEDGEETRFDKHPRFQQLNTDNKALREQAIRSEERIRLLEENRTQAPEEVDFDDISGKSIEDVREDFNENPIAFMANHTRQVRHEIMGEVDAKLEKGRAAQIAETQESKVLETYEKYAKENEGFDAMWDSGELKAHMDKNPGFNAISSHQILTAEKRSGATDATVKTAVDKAVKETETRMTKNFQAKRDLHYLGEGPTGATNSSDTDEVDLILKEPKKFGGTVMAGVKALEARARRRAQAGG